MIPWLAESHTVSADGLVYNTKWFGPYSNKIDGIRFSPVGDGQEMRWAYFK